MRKKLLLLFAICISVYCLPASPSICQPLPCFVYVSASDTTICSGTPVYFTALDSPSGSLLHYKWYKNGQLVGDTTASYVDSLLNNNDSIWVVMICTNNCGDTGAYPSSHIIMTVNLTPAPPILSLVGGYCVGSDSLSVIVGAAASQINWYWNSTLVSTQSLTGDSPIVAVGCCQSSNSVDPYGEFVYQDTLYVNNINGSVVQKYPINSVGALSAPVAAGDGLTGDSLDQMANARGIFIDRWGYLYVCDNNNARVLKFPPGSTAGTPGVVVAGGNGVGSALNQVSNPYGIFVDTAGYIYIADIYEYRIMKFPPNSTSATYGTIVAGGNGFGTALNQFEYALGVWVDLQGNIYAADGNGRILLFPPNSTSATYGTIVAGGNGSGPATNQIGYPTGIYVDPRGYMYVSDRSYGRVILFPPGSTSATYGTEIAGYAPIAGIPIVSTTAPVVFDPTGTYMFVIDYWNYRIVRYTLRQYYTPTTAGVYTATFTSSAGCVSGIYDAINVLAGPTVTWTQSDTSWNSCQHSPGLSNGTPAGGIYSGPFVTSDSIYSDSIMASVMNNGSGDTTFTVTYTFANNAGCSASVSHQFSYVACPQGINNISSAGSISLYPNPNNGSFMLQSSDAIGKEYTITDMLGRVLAQQTITSNNQSIDLAVSPSPSGRVGEGSISAGSYMLSVKDSNSKVVRFAVE